MSGSTWIKIVVGLIIVVMAIAVVAVFVDPGLGDPKTLPRTKHQSGFSIVVPRGWAATIFSGDKDEYMRIVPERATGRGDVVTVTKFTGEAEPLEDNPLAVTFQGQPALLGERTGKWDVSYLLRFERDGTTYQITYATPIATDPLKCELTPFFNTFKVEPVIKIPNIESSLPTTLPASLPTILPAGSPS